MTCGWRRSPAAQPKRRPRRCGAGSEPTHSKGDAEQHQNKQTTRTVSQSLPSAVPRGFGPFGSCCTVVCIYVLVLLLLYQNYKLTLKQLAVSHPETHTQPGCEFDGVCCSCFFSCFLFLHNPAASAGDFLCALAPRPCHLILPIHLFCTSYSCSLSTLSLLSFNNCSPRYLFEDRSYVS